ncbi:MAG: hypothetical protein AABY22_01485 [Nanoarchaeota archaeon]
MKYFFYLDTGGESCSNLQLYSLTQAIKYFNEVTIKYNKTGKDSPALIESYVFIISCLGLSISQLLGQNYSKKEKNIPKLGPIFSDILQREKKIKKRRKKIITKNFDDLIYSYNKCRHFGITIDDSTHKTILNLTYAKTKKYVKITYFLWDLIIKIISKNPDHRLEDLYLLKIKETISNILENNLHKFQPDIDDY